MLDKRHAIGIDDARRITRGDEIENQICATVRDLSEDRHGQNSSKGRRCVKERSREGGYEIIFGKVRGARLRRKS